MLCDIWINQTEVLLSTTSHTAFHNYRHKFVEPLLTTTSTCQIGLLWPNQIAKSSMISSSNDQKVTCSKKKNEYDIKYCATFQTKSFRQKIRNSPKFGYNDQYHLISTLVKTILPLQILTSELMCDWMLSVYLVLETVFSWSTFELTLHQRASC